jgi:hypothetical protein
MRACGVGFVRRTVDTLWIPQQRERRDMAGLNLAGWGEYRSTKIKLAAQMLKIAPPVGDMFGATWSVRVKLLGDSLSDHRETDIEVPADVFRRESSSPRPGDYLVAYKDGYLSWEPRASFEESSKPITRDAFGLEVSPNDSGRLTSGLPFSLALDALRNGATIRRRGNAPLSLEVLRLEGGVAGEDILATDWELVPKEANVHGIGPDTDGGPNPDYRGER